MRSLTRLSVTIVALHALTGCTQLFGDENSTVRPFDVVIVNGSDETIYNVLADSAATEITGRLAGVPPGQSVSVGMGPALDPGPGGCFDRHQMWIVRRTFREVFPAGSQAASFRDELEVIRHLPPDTCTDQAELVVAYPNP